MACTTCCACWATRSIQGELAAWCDGCEGDGGCMVTHVACATCYACWATRSTRVEVAAVSVMAVVVIEAAWSHGLAYVGGSALSARCAPCAAYGPHAACLTLHAPCSCCMRHHAPQVLVSSFHRRVCGRQRGPGTRGAVAGGGAARAGGHCGKVRCCVCAVPTKAAAWRVQHAGGALCACPACLPRCGLTVLPPCLCAMPLTIASLCTLPSHALPYALLLPPLCCYTAS